MISVRRRAEGAWGALLLAVAGWALACSHPVPVEKVKASVTLGEPDRFYESGAPIPLSASVYNPTPVGIDLGTTLLDGTALEIVDSHGEPLRNSRAVPPPPAPPTLPPGHRVKLPIDPASQFPGLARPGKYRLTAVYPLFRSNVIELRILPAFSREIEYRARVVTSVGQFVLGFFPDVAPQHVRNFINLARSGFYDRNLIYRVVPGQLIQTGDPTGTGQGGPGYTIKAEFNHRPHVRGTLSMARQRWEPDSAGSQWFICLDRVPEWDGQYTVFGQVLEGMEVVERIGNAEVRKESEVPVHPVLIRHVTILETDRSRGAGQAE
ncbi:MAG: peptidylprolyl isomerase [Acidobacteriota bacterium]